VNDAPRGSRDAQVAATASLVFGTVAASLTLAALAVYVVASLSSWPVSLLTLVGTVVLASMLAVFSLVFARLTTTNGVSRSARAGSALAYSALALTAVLIVFWVVTALVA